MLVRLGESSESSFFTFPSVLIRVHPWFRLHCPGFRLFPTQDTLKRGYQTGLLKQATVGMLRNNRELRNGGKSLYL